MERKKRGKTHAREPTFEPIDPALAEDQLTMEYEIQKLEKLLPELTHELISGETQSISFADAIQAVDENGDSKNSDAELIDSTFEPTENESTNPDVVSFIRRCSNSEEAIEIITFLEQRREISPEDADQYRSQIFSEGLESFGPKKEPGYYERVFPRKIHIRGEYF